MRPKPLIAGNWKMNGTKASLSELRAMAGGATALAQKCDFLICPPATLLTESVTTASGSPIAVGAQDCHARESGAHTGDISAAMIADAGASFAIIGHSERRTDHAEDDATVLSKAEAALGAGLIAVICIGETETQRVAGETLDILGTQLAGSVPDGATPDNTVIAYEPVWAIGTGRTPTVSDVAEVHDFLRARLVERFGDEAGHGFRLLYGGSVKPQNAAELLGVANVDGALIGGASLKASDFLGIAEACPARA